MAALSSIYGPMMEDTALAAAARVRDTSQFGQAKTAAAIPSTRVRGTLSTRGTASTRVPKTREPVPVPAGPVANFAGCPVVDDLLATRLAPASRAPSVVVGGTAFNALTTSKDLMRLQTEADAARAAAPSRAPLTAWTALAEAREALVDAPGELLAGASVRDALGGRLRGLGVLLIAVCGAGLFMDLVA
jgi:hypothetical protein